MEKVVLYLFQGRGEFRFRSHKDCRRFVNRGDMPKILHKDDLDFDWGRPPNKSIGILVTKYKKIGSSKIEIEYRFLSQREFNLEKLLN